MNKNQIYVNPNTIISVLGGIALILIILSLIGQYGIYFWGFNPKRELVQLFDLNGERNVPAGFSVAILFFASILLFIIGTLEKQSRQSLVLYWKVLFWGFLFLAFDEAFGVHERLGGPTVQILGANNISSLFSYKWVIPISIVVLFLGLFFLKFLFSLPLKIMHLFILSGAIYVGGATIMETIGGHYGKLYGVLTFNRALITTLEESMEIGGVIFFIRALLIYIAETYGAVQMIVGSKTNTNIITKLDVPHTSRNKQLENEVV